MLLSHPTILAMQLDYLYGAGRFTRVMPRLMEHIKATVLGTMPHATTVLNSLLARFANVLDTLPSPLLPTDPAAITCADILQVRQNSRRCALTIGVNVRAQVTNDTSSQGLGLHGRNVCKHGKKSSVCEQGACRNQRKKKAAQKSASPAKAGGVEIACV